MVTCVLDKTPTQKGGANEIKVNDHLYIVTFI